jgi:hypothetical protein
VIRKDASEKKVIIAALVFYDYNRREKYGTVEKSFIPLATIWLYGLSRTTNVVPVVTLLRPHIFAVVVPFWIVWIEIPLVLSYIAIHIYVDIYNIDLEALSAI